MGADLHAKKTRTHGFPARSVSLCQCQKRLLAAFPHLASVAFGWPAVLANARTLSRCYAADSLTINGRKSAERRERGVVILRLMGAAKAAVSLPSSP
jgi:hypothetical protein